MKTKNIIIIIVCIVFAAFVFGTTGMIRLVNASEDEEISADKLIGVLITEEYLDLFDSEQFFTDNIDRLISGGEISESESAKYEGRLYAVLAETEHVSKETGETYRNKEYVFEGINGICHIAPRITDEIGTYWSSSGDEAISDGFVNFISNDAGESVALEGTIYVSTDKNAGNFYFNPVYQTQDGEVYSVSGNGISSAGNSAGASMSHEIKENFSSTIGDVTTTSGSVVKITICYIDKPVKVSILQFDSESTLLSRMECDPDSLPGTLQTQPGTQYIIVETTALSREGTNNITRALYQSDDETLSALYCRDDGICVRKWCEIDWNEQSIRVSN